MEPDRALLRAIRLMGAITAMAIGAGCVSQPMQRAVPAQPPPPETTVYFYPARGQSAQQQDRDKYECHTWAVQQSGFDPSAPGVPPHLRIDVDAGGPPSGAGVAMGAMTGAVLGAAVSPPWQAGPGALLGALTGAAIGGIAESAAAQQRQERMAAAAQDAEAARLERRASDYRRAMSACLEGRGYNVR